MKKIMLVGVGWEQIPLLEKAKEMGLETIVTTTWKKDGLVADKIYEVDSRDITTLEAIFLKEKPHAVLADECDYSMYAVAYLTEKYGLPGPSLYSLTITNNKFLQRELALKAEVLQPTYEMCWSLDSALVAAKNIGFPVMVKPLDNRGSIGVFTAENEEELKRAWYPSIANSHSRMCIIEKYIAGDIVTFEGFCDSKKLVFLAIATKDNYKDTDNVAKVLYYPGIIDDKDINEAIMSAGTQIVKCMRINYGFVHIEFMICRKTKKVYFIEIANRGGGVHISNIILPQITGLDLTKHNLEMALGEEVYLDFNGEYNSKALMYFLSPIGTTTPMEIIETYKDDLLAMYLKKKDRSLDIKTKGALAREGVIIIKGRKFQELLLLGNKIECEIMLPNDECYFRA